MRIIQFENPAGQECLHFTESADRVDDFMPSGSRLINEFEIDDDLFPGTFARETTFKAE